MNKNRFEVYTDAIVAIAATIMVLQLHIPENDTLHVLFDQRIPLLAYLISFFAIYGGWYPHNLVLHQAKHISNRLFLANGVWLVVLTFIPMLSAWVGRSPDATLPEFLYALIFFLWGMTVFWMNHEIERDECNHNKVSILGSKWERFLTYFSYLAAMLLSFQVPIASLYIVGITTVSVLIKRFREKKVLEEKL